MVCILLNSDDAPGKWLAHSLQQVSDKPVKLISAEELVYAPEFTCGFRNGQAFFSIKLNSGFHFHSERAGTIINRINYFKFLHISQFKQEDQAYVQAELHAIFTFLFSILPGNLFNHSSGRGLCGALRSANEWRLMATGADFDIADTIYQDKILSSTPLPSPIFSVVVFNHDCFCQYELSEKSRTSCLKLLELSGEKIIEVYLALGDDKAFFAGATVQPSFAHVNRSFISELNQLLQ